MMIRKLFLMSMAGLISFGCASTSSPETVEKPLVNAEERMYSLDYEQDIRRDLAGEGFVRAEMVGGLNALQKEVNKLLQEMDCPVRGKITVVYIVSEAGDVLDAATAAGIHEACDQIAEEAVMEMKFKPATKFDEPVKIRMGSTVTFN